MRCNISANYDMEQNYLEHLTPQQLAAVKHYEGPALVVAGPGAGKCVTSDTLILTNKGPVYIDQIPDFFTIGTYEECSATVMGMDADKLNRTSTSHWFYMGRKKTIQVTTESGIQIAGTYEHPILVLSEKGALQWKRLDELQSGDVAAIALGTNLWGCKRMDKELAYVLGLLVGDGALSLHGGNFGLARNDARMAATFKSVLERLYNYYNVRKVSKKGTRSVTYHASSVGVKEALEELGLPMVKSPERYVPDSVLRCNKPTVLQFLRGLFDTEASVNGSTFEYTTASERLGKEVQTLLLNLGVRAVRKEKKVNAYPDNTYYRIQVTGNALRVLCKHVPFLLHTKKKERLLNAVNRESNPNKDLILNQQVRLRHIRDNHLCGKPHWHGKSASLIEEVDTEGNPSKLFGIKRYISGVRNPSKKAIERILSFVPKNDSDAVYLKKLANNYTLDPIVKVERKEKRRVFDFTVPVGNSFVGNGVVNHNTASATRRIVHLIREHSVSPHHIVAITFTNKAANEMKERVQQMLPKSATDALRVSTFHSFCARVLRREHEAAGLIQGYTICDDSDAKAYIIQSIALETELDPKKVKGLKDHRDPKKAGRFISDKKQNLQVAQDVFDALDDSSSKEDVFYAKIYLRYEAALKKTQSVDFDDLIMKTVLLLRDDEIRNSYADDIHQLIVDESQDTNTSQYELTKHLSSKHGNIFFIGDGDQSIYRFRGAQPENLLQLGKDFVGLKTYYLEDNFRSTHQIAATANILINYNENREPKLIKARVDGVPVRCIECLDNKQEAAIVVDEILGEVRREKARWKDFAILYRMHTRSRIFEELMVTSNVPHRIIGGVGFYNRAVVKDIVAYLKLVLNPADDASFIRIYNKPARGFGDASYAKIYHVKEDRDAPIIRAFRRRWYEEVLTGKSLAGAEKLRDIFKALYREPRNAVAPLIEKVIDVTGYTKALEINGDAKALEKIEHLEELVQAAKDFDNAHGSGLLRFIEWTALMQNTDKDTGENRVHLMTCHAAKGLEFNRLYVIGAIDGVMPIVRERDDFGHVKSPEQAQKDLEEERRIFFVALTRAERHLTITHTKEEFRYNSVIDCAPSRFLAELGETVDHDTVAGTAAGSYLLSALNKKRGGRAYQRKGKGNYSYTDRGKKKRKRDPYHY